LLERVIGFEPTTLCLASFSLAGRNASATIGCVYRIASAHDL
jgi:hypothetical protein